MQIPADAIANAARAVEQYQVMAPALERALKSIQTNELVIERVQELIRRYSPDNWHDLESSELDVVDLVQQSGIPVVWVPRAEVIEAPRAADSGARYAALMSSSADVLEDLEAALSRARGVDVRGHAEAIEFADQAVAAARDGHWWAAQALAASGLGQVLHRMLEYRVFRDAYKKFSERDIEEADMTVLKAALLEVCTAKALTNTDKAQPSVSTATASSTEIAGSSLSRALSAPSPARRLGEGVRVACRERPTERRRARWVTCVAVGAWHLRDAALTVSTDGDHASRGRRQPATRAREGGNLARSDDCRVVKAIRSVVRLKMRKMT